jgi:hypothetical protein
MDIRCPHYKRETGKHQYVDGMQLTFWPTAATIALSHRSDPEDCNSGTSGALSETCRLIFIGGQ